MGNNLGLIKDFFVKSRLSKRAIIFNWRQNNKNEILIYKLNGLNLNNIKQLYDELVA